MILTKFLIPLFLSIFIIIVDYKFNLFQPIKSGVNIVATPILSIINYPYDIYNDINPVTKNNNNVTLQQENLVLKAKLQRYNSLLLDNKKISELLNYSYNVKMHTPLMANITNIQQSRLKRQIIINKGLLSGVKLNQIVLGEIGVIGRVIDVGMSYSSVRLISDPLQHTPVINQRSGEKGVARGLAVSQNKMAISFVLKDADIKVGDVFLTSGSGGLFHSRYPFGIVDNIINADDDFMTITLKPVQRISNTYFVIVDVGGNEKE